MVAAVLSRRLTDSTAAALDAHIASCVMSAERPVATSPLSSATSVASAAAVDDVEIISVSSDEDEDEDEGEGEGEASGANRDPAAATEFGIDLRAVAEPRRYLGDAAINGFLDLLQRRCRGSVLLLSTFFVEALRGAGGDLGRVRRWTSATKLQKRVRVDSVFNSSLTAVLVPVNVRGGASSTLGSSSAAGAETCHWFLVAIDLVDRTLTCLDSARADAAAWDPSNGRDTLGLLERWLQDLEAREVREDHGVIGAPSPTTVPAPWKMDLAPPGAPQRDPALGGDCGMFTCAAADYWSAAEASGAVTASSPPTRDVSERYGPYTSREMPELRRRMASALLAVAGGTHP